jgi:hypothetical protein
MPEINTKFVVVIIIAAIVIFSGLSLFHETYDARPYTHFKIPTIFKNETKMLSFNTDGTSSNPIQNTTVTLHGYVKNKNGKFLSGSLNVFNYPWVVHTTLKKGYYSVTILKFGSFVVGYKVNKYNSAYASFTLLSGNSICENVTVTPSACYAVSGTTVNHTKSIVPNVGIDFISFFGGFTTSSNSKGYFNTTLQNGTYAIKVFKRNYDTSVIPQFLNVTGKKVQNLQLTMNKSKNATYFISGYVFNKLHNPISGANVTSISTSNGSFGSTLTNSSGYYSVRAPYGFVYVQVKDVGYLENKSTSFDLKSDLFDVNFSIQALDPFVKNEVGPFPTGIVGLPSFMLGKGHSSLTNNLSSVDYRGGHVLSGNVSIQLENVFYHTNSTRKDLMSTFYAVAFGYFNGTIYHVTITVNNTGAIHIPIHFLGSFKLLIYVPGFNLSVSDFNFDNSSATPQGIIKTLQPLPGQYHSISGNTYNPVDGKALLYPNITLLQNSMIVNTSIEQSKNGGFSFYFFLDNSQKAYGISLSVVTEEAGFINSTYPLSINSTNSHNVTGLAIKSQPLLNIGSNFASQKSSFKEIPGFNLSRLNSALKNSISSNIYNHGNSQEILNLNNKTTQKSKYIIYAKLNGMIYSTIVSTSGRRITLNTSFSSFFNFTAINQFNKSFNNPTTPSSSFARISLKARNVSQLNILARNNLNETVNSELKSYGANLTLNVPVTPLNAVNSAIPLVISNSTIQKNGTQYVYDLPSARYQLQYSAKGFITNSTSITHSNSSLQRKDLNISEYGIVTILNSTQNLSYKIIARNSGKPIDQMNYTINTSHKAFYVFASNTILSGQDYYFKVIVGTVDFNGKAFSVNYKKPMETQYINISSSLVNSTFTVHPAKNPNAANGTYLFNNSVLLGNNSGTLLNMEVVSQSNYIPYEMLTGSYLTIDNKTISTLNSNSDNFSGLNFKYSGNQPYYITINLEGKLSFGTYYFSVYIGEISISLNNNNGSE